MMAITIARRESESIELTETSTGKKILVRVSKISGSQVKLTFIDAENSYIIMRTEIDTKLAEHKERLFRLAKSLKESEN